MVETRHWTGNSHKFCLRYQVRGEVLIAAYISSIFSVASLRKTHKTAFYSLLMFDYSLRSLTFCL